MNKREGYWIYVLDIEIKDMKSWRNSGFCHKMGVYKFLVDRSGIILKRYAPVYAPEKDILEAESNPI